MAIAAWLLRHFAGRRRTITVASHFAAAYFLITTGGSFLFFARHRSVAHPLRDEVVGSPGCGHRECFAKNAKISA
jgi:hypothetical protein